MKYFTNTSWLVFEKIIRLLTVLFVTIWIARYLGPEQFGLFSYVQNFILIFTAIAALGLDGIAIIDLVKNEKNSNEIAGTTFFLKIIGAGFSFLLLIIVILLLNNDSFTNMLLFVSASVLFFQAFNVIDFYFQSKVISKYSVFANSISLLASSIIKIVLIINNFPLIYFVFMIVFDGFVLALGYIYFFKYTGNSIKTWKFNAKYAATLIKRSWPLMLSSVVITIYMKIDQIIIKELLDNESVGQYAAAVRISESWYFVPMVIVSSVFPALINAKTISRELFYDRFLKLFSLVFWIACSFSIIVTIFSEYIINILYGQEYSEAANLLIIHIWAGVFASIGIVSAKLLLINNRQINGLIATLVGAILNIMFNFILINKYGLVGAAFALLISQIVSGFIVPIWAKIDRNYPKIVFYSIFLIRNKIN